jgi:hypothetical protein
MTFTLKFALYAYCLSIQLFHGTQCYLRRSLPCGIKFHVLTSFVRGLFGEATKLRSENRNDTYVGTS